MPAAKAGTMNELLDSVFGVQTDTAPALFIEDQTEKLDEAVAESEEAEEAEEAEVESLEEPPATIPDEITGEQMALKQALPQTERKNVIAILRERKVKFKDKRNKGGSLWITGGQELLPLIEECREAGYIFKYSANGSKQTRHKPGWYLPEK